jgi:hypothetical protein
MGILLFLSSGGEAKGGRVRGREGKLGEVR